MNEAIAQGKWKEIKGEVKKAWAELTGDEVERTNGNLESLAGLLQRKFGYAKEEAKEKLSSFLAKFEEGVNTNKKSASDRVNSNIDEAKAKVRKE
jgi:uncharacterized protein YjbJ (UPF0337 family)